jgi:hypothetical protein
MSTRTEIIPAEMLHLNAGEHIARSEVNDGRIIVTIVTQEVGQKSYKSGQFFETVKAIHRECEVDPSIWSNPDPRVRAILDR